MRVKIDPDALTLGDLEDFEVAAGMPITALVGAAEENASPPIKAVIAIVWIVRRKDQPGYTMDDARGEHLGDVVLDFTADDEEEGGAGDPTVPAAAVSG